MNIYYLMTFIVICALRNDALDNMFCKQYVMFMHASLN